MANIQNTVEYYLVLKNELSSHKRTWENLEDIAVCERSQYDKATYSVIPSVCILDEAKLWMQ